MPKITPAQQSFSAGEISPLMYNRTDTEGYKQGVMVMENMFPDSRGAAFSRGGGHFVGSEAGNDARIIAMPVNDNFFYSGLFLEHRLIIGSMVGHNPSVVYNQNANFNQGQSNWNTDNDGNATSNAIFSKGNVALSTDNNNNRWVNITAPAIVPSAGDYLLVWNMVTVDGATIKVGTAEGLGDIYDSGVTTLQQGSLVFTSPQTNIWIEARVDGNVASAGDANFTYLGITDENPSATEFVTPYLEEHLSALQGTISPEGGAIYILHELYPPYKLVYDRIADAFTWIIVTFMDDADPPQPAQPPEWADGSYPSSGDFFEGRLWLGGTVNEPQTFWASKSGSPEVFVKTGADPLATDPLEFTMAKFGRIEWMVGFKNLVIGTQNGEHIVTSEGGFIQYNDIQVEQQSSYGSANIQPVQVGDQIFYVSADRRKLRAIQYEWQRDNWLSKDLTFNSEHITKAGIKHITWQQNPNNLFHCLLEDGTVASLTYERSHDVYGWARLVWGGGGRVIDATTGAIRGTDYINILVQYNDGSIYFETQVTAANTQFMDSWTEKNPEPDGVTVTGLEHLEGQDVQVLVDGATHPDRVVSGGQITLQSVTMLTAVITVGLEFRPKIVTLPMNRPMASGSSEPYVKRWNKIYVRVLNSTKPLINGERSPERQPQSPMNEPQPNVDEEILNINLGFSRNQVITIEQDLPHRLIVLGIFGELAQSIT